MVKALVFKGDKKPKKRKRTDPDDEAARESGPSTNALIPASSAADDDDDSWVTADSTEDIAGPVIMVLPTEPLSCLASDANGKIFTSEIENIIEGDPGTAEPHDVRQVWVANRVAGTQSFSFKGHHGRYLGCDKFGILSATKEAVSSEESFLVIAAPDSPSMFALQTLRDKIITTRSSDSVAHHTLRGDAEAIDFNSTFRIRAQARFKPRLKASKEEKIKEKISRMELEEAVGRRLDDSEVKRLKKARREGDYHEALLDIKVKGKHDKFA